ncbi:MAG: hypothetical protein WD423_11740 [Rhodothermales bacterium]
MTPLETSLRMIEHMPEDASYGDIIRQLRILEDIENTLNDVDVGGFPADDAVEEAKMELETRLKDPDPRPVEKPSGITLRSEHRADRQSPDDRSAEHRDALLQEASWHL